jgi:hypothetical protein
VAEPAGPFDLERQPFYVLSRKRKFARGVTTVTTLVSRIYLDRGWDAANLACATNMGTLVIAPGQATLNFVPNS